MDGDNIQQVYNGWQPCPGPVGTTPEPTAEIQEDGSLLGATCCKDIPSEQAFSCRYFCKLSSCTLTYSDYIPDGMWMPMDVKEPSTTE